MIYQFATHFDIAPIDAATRKQHIAKLGHTACSTEKYSEYQAIPTLPLKNLEIVKILLVFSPYSAQWQANGFPMGNTIQWSSTRLLSFF
ncbi:hypothetical protein [Comamonas composti]|uniref:hypothetical protein n=1 Tax=Comamonas composti TaxID=408558 RepID=UPI00146FB34A|nr:hypothetical protein [Comamonas composti]